MSREPRQLHGPRWPGSFGFAAGGYLARAVGLALCVAFALTGACGEPDPADVAMTRTAQLRTYFSDPGTRFQNGTNEIADDILVQVIDDARSTIDFAVMGFSRDSIIQALIRARIRGVRVRMVGDARYRESNDYGYRMLDEFRVPMQVGNMYHIMHNKFFVIDGRVVFVGTGNISGSEFNRSDNNWVAIWSPQVADLFTAEFEQMFGGAFGFAKQALGKPNVFRVGDVELEVNFSPREDTMGRMVQAVLDAEEAVYFYIFAFTKDELGAALIQRHLEFSRYNRCCDPASRPELPGDELDACDEQVVCVEPFRRREVRGVMDRSQLHGNGPYHEAYRMLMWGVPLLLDGNRNSYNPGDYQAGGGRQHSKTMVIDPWGANPTVLTGSFNWSSSATVSNDENLLIMRSERVAREYMFQFDRVWGRATLPGEDWSGPGGRVRPGDIIINEIHWDGWNGENDPITGRPVYNDEFIELLNTTGRTIDLSLWQITDGDDFIVGFFPGTVIGPYERFLVVDHNIVAYDDIRPQDGDTAFRNAEFVMNPANDQRFLRLNLGNASLRLELSDPRGNVIDVAGDWGAPFFGGRRLAEGGLRNYSMERRHYLECFDDPDCEVIRPGHLPEAWQRCAAPEGGVNVTERFRSYIIATPGEPNSGGEGFPDEDPTFRLPPAP